MFFDIIFLVFFLKIITLFGNYFYGKIKILPTTSKIVSSLVFSFGIGLGLFIVILTILAFLGLFDSIYVWLVIMVFWIIGLKNYKGLFSKFKLINFQKPSLSRLEIFSIIFISILSFFYLIVGLSPTLDGDSLCNYLLLPKQYVLNNELSLVDFAVGSIYPQNGHLLISFGLLLKDQIFAQILIVWVMGNMSVLVIYLIAKYFFSRRIALFGALIWYSMYSVAYLAATAKIDLAWAFFDLLSLYAFFNWYFSKLKARNINWLFLSGFLIGIASGIKQASFFTVLAMVLGIIFDHAKNKNLMSKVFLKNIFSICLPFSISFVWIFRTYFLTGLPFYTGKKLIGENGLMGFFRVLWDMSMLGNATSIEGPMGKSIGPILIAILPILFFYKNLRTRKVLTIISFCFFMLILWYNGVQRARHLLPTLAILSILTSYVFEYFTLKKLILRYFILFLMIASINLNLAPWFYLNFISIERLEFIFGKQDIDMYLKSNLDKYSWYPNYELTKKINSLPMESKIAALATANSFYLNRPLYCRGPAISADGWWTKGETDYPNDNIFLKKLHEFGFTHVFINDHVVEKWKMEGSWLNQSQFQIAHLKRILSKGGQHLFEIN